MHIFNGYLQFIYGLQSYKNTQQIINQNLENK